MNAHAVDGGKPGIVGVIDKVEALRPTDIARAREQFRCHRAGNDTSGSRNQITLPHGERMLAHQQMPISLQRGDKECVARSEPFQWSLAKPLKRLGHWCSVCWPR